MGLLRRFFTGFKAGFTEHKTRTDTNDPGGALEVTPSSVSKEQPKETLDDLIGDLLGQNSDRSEKAEARLAELKDPNAIPALVHALGREHDYYGRRAKAGLVAIGPASVPPLVVALQHSHDKVRWGAADVLGDLKDPKAVDALCAALENSDDVTRWVAARSLGRIGDPKAVPHLVRALKEQSDCKLRRHASEALQVIGVPSLDALVPLFNDADPDVSHYAREANRNILARSQGQGPSAKQSPDWQPLTMNGFAEAVDAMMNRATGLPITDPQDIPLTFGEFNLSEAWGTTSIFSGSRAEVKRALLANAARYVQTRRGFDCCDLRLQQDGYVIQLMMLFRDAAANAFGSYFIGMRVWKLAEDDFAACGMSHFEGNNLRAIRSLSR